ncbi:Secretion system effector C (SseC) like family [Chlamydia serpentis]|uniref:Secretion system effector C (SseC) like family n=1 Tax=Chlamydia serpentis TaxID=1967782 RepID=A0A2R8FC40_9CHLA|nr:secretion system protein [Chlamydia serpentis]SPN73921.1 Secretion system effector C (SseC) like family [Chlamydia serpentis]
MSISSSSGPDNQKNIMSQVLTSTPQGVPQQDKLAGNENKQIQQTRQGKNTEMESDSAIAGTAGKDKTSSASKTESSPQQGVAAGKESIEGGKASSDGSGKVSGAAATDASKTATKIAMQTSIEEASKTMESTLESLQNLSAMQMQEVEEVVLAALSGKQTNSAKLETPELPKPGITPRSEVIEIGLALAKAIQTLGEATKSALSNYASTQAQADQSNKLGLEKQALKIDAERKEYQEMKAAEQKSKDLEGTMETVNTVMIAVSVVITVLSIVAAIFTCGAGLAGLAAGAAVGAAAAGGAAGAAAATTVATQITVQAVVQAVKQAVVEAIKQAISQAIKAAIKSGIKAFIKTLVKAIAKAISKAVSKVFSKGTQMIAKNFPKLSKVMSSLTSKWVTIGVGAMVAAPALGKGIMQTQLSEMQNKVAEFQKEVGKLQAAADMISMFTQFWQQASKIAAKQTGETDDMTEKASKLGGQILKAYAAISGALASAA